jgi:hypothetical protein
VDITTDSIRALIRARQELGAANGTINRSLALLRRMFHIAVKDGKLREIPHFPMLKEASPRKGFLEHAHYQRLRQELPEASSPGVCDGLLHGDATWRDPQTALAECGFRKCRNSP